MGVLEGKNSAELKEKFDNVSLSCKARKELTAGILACVTPSPRGVACTDLA